MNKFEIATIDGKQVVLAGIGKLFYEEGFPIHISVDILKEKGLSVSVLHIADELYKNGWSEKAIVKTLSQDFEGSESIVSEFIKVATAGEPRKDLPPNGEQWIYSENGYDLQREMLFQWLFNFESSEAFSSKEKRTELMYLV